MPKHRSLVAQQVRNRTLEQKEFNNEMPQVAVIVKEAKKEDEKEDAEMSAKRKKKAEVRNYSLVLARNLYTVQVQNSDTIIDSIVSDLILIPVFFRTPLRFLYLTFTSLTEMMLNVVFFRRKESRT